MPKWTVICFNDVSGLSIGEINTGKNVLRMTSTIFRIGSILDGEIRRDDRGRIVVGGDYNIQHMPHVPDVMLQCIPNIQWIPPLASDTHQSMHSVYTESLIERIRRMGGFT